MAGPGRGKIPIKISKVRTKHKSPDSKKLFNETIERLRNQALNYRERAKAVWDSNPSMRNHYLKQERNIEERIEIEGRKFSKKNN